MPEIKGFTLAEVLITLTVVGIVAGMVIPGIVNNTNEKELKAKWKKAYADIDHATKLLMTDNGGILSNDMFIKDATAMSNAYKPYFNIQKDCSIYSHVNRCFCDPDKQDCTTDDTKIKKLDGSQPIESFVSLPDLILNNGVIIGFLNLGVGCPNSNNAPMVDFLPCGEIIIDVNSFKGPNTWGKDTFKVWVYKDKIKPFGWSASINCPNSDGEDCSAKYLME